MEIKLSSQRQEYGGKLIRRLTNVFDSSQLRLVGGKFDGQKAKSPHLLPLSNLPLKVGVSLGEVAAFNRMLPRVARHLLFEGSYFLSKEGYVEGLGGYDARNLPALAVMLAQGNGLSRPVVRLVYGATQEMPLRGLSYLLPALVLMEQLSIDGINIPQFQVIFANNISSRLNRIDLSVARRESRRLVEIASSYIHQFFPNLENSTVFLEDTPLDRGTLLRDELLKVTKVITDDTVIREDLKIKGRNNGSSHSYLFYCAAHPLMHDADFHGSFASITCDQAKAITPTAIISFGGTQERFFYELRQKIKPLLGQEYNDILTLQYFTRHRVPPYYMAKDGDLSLKDAVLDKTTNIGKTASYDIDYLYEISDRRGDFKSFLDSLRRDYYE